MPSLPDWKHHSGTSCLWIIMDTSHRLCVQIGEDNAFYDFAVAIWKDLIVGHVPRSRVGKNLLVHLKKWHSSVICKITGHRRLSEVEGKGLVVPCVYIFTGKTKHIDKMIAIFADKYSYLFQPVWTGFVAIFRYTCWSCCYLYIVVNKFW